MSIGKPPQGAARPNYSQNSRRCPDVPGVERGWMKSAFNLLSGGVLTETSHLTARRRYKTEKAGATAPARIQLALVVTPIRGHGLISGLDQPFSAALHFGQ
jgi:hypothetical protein